MRGKVPCSILWFAILAAASAAGASVTAAAAQADCAAWRSPSGWRTFIVHSGGQERALRLYVPRSATAAKLPLVFDLHGSGGSGASQAALSGLSAVADRHGFLVANPDGGVQRTQPPAGHFWNIPGVPLIGNVTVPDDAPDEVQFISDALDQISAAACVDAHRVYATGMSGGARMASLLACRLAGRLAAVAAVAGVRAGLASESDAGQPDPASCEPERPVPLLVFHGVRDPVNPYDGGGYDYWSYGVPAALGRWAQIDQCPPLPVQKRLSPTVTLLRYRNCASGTEIVFYRTDAPLERGGGHIWPGSRGARAANGLKASELIWQFFSRHPSSMRPQT
ncbi:MAG: PHB depolymerase family esterase [Steroidobacteraceae bacterium]